VSRVVSKLVAATVVTAVTVLVAAPAGASPSAVDPDRGPVAFANVASLAVTDNGHGTPGGSVISETQRSPLTPGTSRLGKSRSALPGSEGERAAVGPNYLLEIDHHDVSATLHSRGEPSATARADYVLTDLAAGTPVLSFTSSVTHVACEGVDDVKTEASADRLAVVDATGELTPVALPAPGDEVRRAGLPFGASVELGDDEEATSDITVRRVADFADLLRQDPWRDGDVTAVSGWVVEIDTHVRSVEARDHLDDQLDLPEPTAGAGESGSRTIRTTLVLGGVSCSIPHDFVAGGGGGAEPRSPSVPATIPAGVGAPGDVSEGETEGAVVRAAVPQDGGHASTWGVGLLAGGAVLGAAAWLLTRHTRTSGRRP
jgi:hypothetical protein